MDLDICKKNPRIHFPRINVIPCNHDWSILEKKKISDPDLQSLEINPTKRVEI